MVELHIFIPAEDGEYQSELHEDDGLSFAFRDGAYYRTTFTLRRSGARFSFAATVAGDGYPEFARRAFALIFHGATPTSVHQSGRRLAAEAGRYRVDNAGAAMQVEVELASL